MFELFAIPPIDFYNPRSLAVFVCILQGLIFAALLIFRWFKQRKSADAWLAVLLLLLSSSLITPFIGFANVYDNNQWLTYFPFAVAYSYGVCVWFYTVSLLEPDRKFNPRQLLYFAPSAAYLLFRFFLFSHDLEWKGWFDKSYGAVFGSTVFVTEFVWNFVFLILAIGLYRRYRSWLNDNFSDTEKIKFNWLRNFLYLFTGVLMLAAVFDFINSFLFRLSYIQYFYFEIVLAFVTYYLAIAGYLRSKTIDVEFHSAPSVPESDERRLLLNEDGLEKLKERLLNVIHKEKPHLDPQLTLTELSKNLGVNSSVLSFVINNGFGKNFNDFINGFRIEEVKSRLSDAEGATLLGIAFECGFNSKATFNRAFKKFTGTTPRVFQDSANGRNNV
ncbi:MAG: helix-turn-helix domain-containing protein [Acidobacteria bacterium]|nr:helix-turn-helix domain-containing protein [Acidobacteriota bacterium]